MALDQKITSNVEVKLFGDVLDKEMSALFQKITAGFTQLAAHQGKMTKGGADAAKNHAQILKTTMQNVQQFAKLDTLATSIATKTQRGFYSQQAVQNAGKMALEISKIQNGLTQTSSAADVLALRLAKARAEAEKLGRSGTPARASLVARTKEIEASIKDMRALESSVRTMNQNASARGGYSGQQKDVNAQLVAAQAALSAKAGKGNTSNFEKEIGLVRKLRDELKGLIAEEALRAKNKDKNAAKSIRGMEAEENRINRLASAEVAARKKIQAVTERQERAIAAAERRDDALRKQRASAQAQAVSLQDRTNKLMVPAYMQQDAKRLGGADAVLTREKLRQVSAQNQLNAAQGKSQLQAQKALELANARVKYAERLVAAELRVAAATAKTQRNISTSEAELRANIDRGANRLKSGYTREQARGFDPANLDRGINSNIARLGALQQAMARAYAPGSTKSQEAIDRMSRSWEMLSQRVTTATAKRKAFDALPENRNQGFLQGLTDGGLKGLAGRAAGGLLLGGTIGAGYAALGAMTNGIRTVVQFEDALARLQAISGSTDQEMVKLAGSIRSVASNSKFSTNEIAESATQIAQAGFSASETALVLKDSLTLATISGSSPTESVDTMTSALGAFGLQASESGRVLEILAQGLNRTKLTMTQMQSAIQYAGATAKENGVRFEELTAIAGSLANAGIRSGSTIGTGMRQLLVDLKTPTEDFKAELSSLGLTLADTDVKALGLAQVVRNLTEAGFSAEAAYSSFEVRAASSFLAFRNQLGNYDQLTLSLAQTGAAAEANERAMGSLSAQMQNLKNNLQAAAEGALQPFLDMLKLVVGGANLLIKGFKYLNNESSGVIGMMTQMVGVIYAVNLAMRLNPVLGLVSAFLLLTEGIRQLIGTNEDLVAKVNDAEAALGTQQDTLSALDTALDEVISRQALLRQGGAPLQAEIINQTARFAELSSGLHGTKMGYMDLINAMIDYRGEVAKNAASNATAVVISKTNLRDDIYRGVDANKDSFQNLNYTSGPEKTAAAVGKENLGAGLAAQTKIQDQLNILNRIKNPNAGIISLITLLQERKDLMVRAASLNLEINTAQTLVDTYNTKSSAGGRRRDEQVVEAGLGFAEGQRGNKDTPGSGTPTINATMATAKRNVQTINKLLENKDISDGRRASLLDDKSRLENLMNGVVSATARDEREAAKGAGSDRATAGQDIKAPALANMVRGEFKGANVYSTGTRSLQEQQRLYDLYKSGKGALAAVPGTSKHGTGNAFDMTPIEGVSLDQVTAFIESKGVEVTSAIPELNPATGRTHWHFQWKPKSSSYANKQSSEADKAAKELQSLMEYEAGANVRAATDNLDTLGIQAKNGKVNAAGASTQFEVLSAALRETRLAKFDIERPTEGLGADALKQRGLARTAEEAAITANLAEYHEKIWGYLGDGIKLALDMASELVEQQLEQANRTADVKLNRIQAQIGALDNDTNRGHIDAGTRYIFGQEEKRRKLESDQAKIANSDAAANQLGTSINVAKVAAGNLGAGAAQDEANKAILDQEAKLNDIYAQRSILMASVATQTEKVYPLSLLERIRGGIGLWRENSGAMDSFATTVGNNIEPMLNNLTDGFSDFFSSIANGTKSFKQALGDMLRSFIGFVQQMIIRALALYVIQQLIGLVAPKTAGGTPGQFNGNVTASNPGGLVPIGSFNGGPVVATRGLFNGGPTHRLMGGGAVKNGFSTKDSADYQLAHGEYVIRNKSVKDLGLPFMDAINKQGKAGLSKMGGAGSAFMNIQQPKQETNVWVVQDKQQASMGPNDVLVTIHRDILQNGPTKRLIRQVAQGG